MIDAVFLYESLHGVVKLFSHRLSILRTSLALSNYLGDSFSHLVSSFALEWHGPCVLAHIDDGEYVMMASVETRVRKHLDDIGLLQVIVSSIYDVSLGKLFLTEACSSSTSRRLSELTIFSCPLDLLIAMQSSTDCVTMITLQFMC